MAIAQPMSTVEYVSMLSVLKITGARERELTNYLKQYIGKTFCPTQNKRPMLTKGHTKVYTSSILWTYKQVKVGDSQVVGKISAYRD